MSRKLAIYCDHQDQDGVGCPNIHVVDARANTWRDLLQEMRRQHWSISPDLCSKHAHRRAEYRNR